MYNNPEDVGSVLRTILKRLEENSNNESKQNTKWGCLHCKHYVRKEGYNQQWGMYQFYNCYCNKGIKDKYIINDGKQSNCDNFEEGENKLIYMSDKEKAEIENSYFK